MGRMVPMSTIGDVVRRLLDSHGPCRACLDGIRVSHHLDVMGNLCLTAFCHGTQERHVVDAVDLMRRDPADMLKPVASWIKNLFAADCNPDVMELLRYNRGEVPS